MRDEAQYGTEVATPLARQRMTEAAKQRPTPVGSPSSLAARIASRERSAKILERSAEKAGRSSAEVTAAIARLRDPRAAEAEAKAEAESKAEIQAQMRDHRVFVRGRFRPDGRRVFDVIKMDGGKWSLYATNCMWVEQALEFADSCLSGRTTVSLSNARALLVPDRRSGLYVPDRKLDPRHVPTQLKPLDGKALHESGLIEVSRETKKAPA